MCFYSERFGLRADLEPPRGASSRERISLAEAYEQMWANVINKDLTTSEAVLQTETLVPGRQKKEYIHEAALYGSDV